MKIQGNILTMLERADDEFTKLLQSTDAHSTEYVNKYACTYIQYIHLRTYIHLPYHARVKVTQNAGCKTSPTPALCFMRVLCIYYTVCG